MDELNLIDNKTKSLTIRTMNGFGDLCWVMCVIGNIREMYPNLESLNLKIQLAGDHRDSRAIHFVSRFKIFDSITEEQFLIYNQPHGDGRIKYIDNGWNKHRSEYTLIVNPHIEWEGRIETMMPELPICWDFFDKHYEVLTADKKWVLRTLGQKYMTIHLGNFENNTINGMNKGNKWSLKDWYNLISLIYNKYRLPVCILGSSYDNDYTKEFLSVYGSKLKFIKNMNGKTDGPQLIEILRASKLNLSFASGVGISSVYLGSPTVMFWQPEGTTVSPMELLHFSNDFSTNWIPPDSKYYPAFHGIDTFKSVFENVNKLLIN